MKNIITAIIFFFSLTNITATVGGPQELTAIGYSDEEVFFVREYFDESASGRQRRIRTAATRLLVQLYTLLSEYAARPHAQWRDALSLGGW